MKWKTYQRLREEASLGSATPEMGSPTNGLKHSPAPASDEVKRTNLQPQVDAKPADTKAGLENDRIGAIDADLERLDASLPEENSDTPRVNQFRQLWKQMKDQWDQIKTSDTDEGGNDPNSPLGNDMGNPQYLKTMQQNPNMAPSSDQQLGAGPGTMGNY